MYARLRFDWSSIEKTEQSDLDQNAGEVSGSDIEQEDTDETQLKTEGETTTLQIDIDNLNNDKLDKVINQEDIQESVAELIQVAKNTSTKPVFKINISNTKEIFDVTVKLPKLAMESLAKADNTEVVLTVGEKQNQSVYINNLALKEVVGKLKADTMSLAIKSIEPKDEVVVLDKGMNNVKLYDITIKSGEEIIGNLKEKVKVVVPYKLKENEVESDIAVYSVKDKAKNERIQHKYDAKTQTIEFDINSLGTYMIVNQVATQEEFINNFSDVSKDDWYFEAVNFVQAKNILRGISETEFAPNKNMTRAMVWTMLARYDGSETDGGEAWYSKGKQWAIDNSISDGSNLNGNITREELVTMLYRYDGNSDKSAELTGYKDKDKVSKWAVDAMNWAVENGIITGMENEKLMPQSKATRAQVAKIMMGYYNLKNNEKQD